MLWALILGFCGGSVAVFGARLPPRSARVIGVLGAVSSGFLLFRLA